MRRLTTLLFALTLCASACADDEPDNSQAQNPASAAPGDAGTSTQCPVGKERICGSTPGLKPPSLCVCLDIRG